MSGAAAEGARDSDDGVLVRAAAGSLAGGAMPWPAALARPAATVAAATPATVAAMGRRRGGSHGGVLRPRGRGWVACDAWRRASRRGEVCRTATAVLCLLRLALHASDVSADRRARRPRPVGTEAARGRAARGACACVAGWRVGRKRRGLRRRAGFCVPVAPHHPPPPPSTLLRSSGGRGVWAVSHGSGGAARWRERRRASPRVPLCRHAAVGGRRWPPGSLAAAVSVEGWLFGGEGGRLWHVVVSWVAEGRGVVCRRVAPRCPLYDVRALPVGGSWPCVSCVYASAAVEGMQCAVAGVVGWCCGCRRWWWCTACVPSAWLRPLFAVAAAQGGRQRA